MRRSLGSLEVQTWQLHPSVGTPMDVPLPKKTISAGICPFHYGKPSPAFSLRLLASGGLLRRIGGIARDSIGNLQEHHT